MKVITVILFASSFIFSSCQLREQKGENQKVIVEITTENIEDRKSAKVLKNVIAFLEEKKETEPIVQNYWYLCDTSNINSLRNFDVNHKTENIRIDLGKSGATVSPFPGVYKISEGPFAEYKINDDSLGKMHSYLIEIEFLNDFNIKDFKAVLRFSKKQENGLNRVTFKKEILKGEDYLIEQRVKTGKW